MLCAMQIMFIRDPDVEIWLNYCKIIAKTLSQLIHNLKYQSSKIPFNQKRKVGLDIICVPGKDALSRQDLHQSTIFWPHMGRLPQEI